MNSIFSSTLVILVGSLLNPFAMFLASLKEILLQDILIRLLIVWIFCFFKPNSKLLSLMIAYYLRLFSFSWVFILSFYLASYQAVSIFTVLAFWLHLFNWQDLVNFHCFIFLIFCHRFWPQSWTTFYTWGKNDWNF